MRRLTKGDKNLMLNGWRLVLACFIVFSLGPACHAGEIKRETPEKIIKKGAWELQIVYRNKGTRSEGQHGILLYEGVPVEGKQCGEVKETDLGLMKYYGPESKEEVPWKPSGWNFADQGRILPSREEKEN